jgi:heme-degrading monooxygenase HmoA
MYTRAVEIRIKPAKTNEHMRAFTEQVLPILKAQTGFVDVVVLRSDTAPNRVVGLSFWQTKEDAERFHREQNNRIREIVHDLIETEPVFQTFDVEFSTIYQIATEKAA